MKINLNLNIFLKSGSTVLNSINTKVDPVFLFVCGDYNFISYYVFVAFFVVLIKK